MKINLFGAAALGMLATLGVAFAQQPTVAPMPPVAPASTMAAIMATAPVGSVTVTNWYKQNVYDLAGAKVGDISDVLVSLADGKISAVVIGVGGFLGMGEKEVGVPFSAVTRGMKDGKSYLTINTTKEALAAARALKYDGKTSTWILADASAK